MPLNSLAAAFWMRAARIDEVPLVVEGLVIGSPEHAAKHMFPRVWVQMTLSGCLLWMLALRAATLG